MADESAAQAAVQVALDAFGRLDVVVNNAGFGDMGFWDGFGTVDVTGRCIALGSDLESNK